MSEEDIKASNILHQRLRQKWDIKKITMETNITDRKNQSEGEFCYQRKAETCGLCSIFEF